MAEEKKPENSGLTTTIPITVVLALLAGLVFTHSLPYQDERPSIRPLQTRYAAAQDVDTRLWQDPFAAVEDASEETPTEKVFIVESHNGKTLQVDATKQVASSSSHLRGQIYKGENITSKDKITVLAVTLPGGPYQEAAEIRMRRRYAVLSALANQEAAPQDEEHIGYFHPDSKPKMALQKRVAFEWWLLSGNKGKVLLLWVDESSLSGCTAAKIKELLTQASQDNLLKQGNVFNYAVIGPNTSTLLRDMLKEIAEDNKNVSINQCADKSNNDAVKTTLGEINGRNIVYFSAGATASDEDLLKDIVLVPKCKTISKCLGGANVNLYRTTATDDAMMRILVKELDVRQVKAHYNDPDIMHWLPEKLGYHQDMLDEQEDYVVILSEWDTFYGRVMPDAFKSAWRGNMHVYGYMRGLDGKLPEHGDKAVNVAEKKSDSKDKSDVDVLIEFPEGQNQKDYLRRLTNSIIELDQNLKDKGSKKGVAAIGVLGSDVHDKLMIMEALRQYFPHKLFFTTDLDAAYSHPAKQHQTHNLLVASAFDLKLRREFQDKIPPFRDSYQTAFFLATQMVLNNDKNIPERFGMPAPRLFEIGRSHLIPLPTQDDTVLQTRRDDIDRLHCSVTNWSGCITDSLPLLLGIERSRNGKESPPSLIKNEYIQVQPRMFATSHFNWTVGGMIAVLIVVMMAVIMLTFVSWQVRKQVQQLFNYSKSHPHFVIGISVIFLGFAYWLTELWNDYMIRFDAEPFYWMEGVSAWPSQLLRFSAFLFALGFFCLGHKRILNMQRDFQVPPGDSKSGFALPQYDKINVVASDVLFIGSWKEDEATAVYPNELWKKYLGYCRAPGSIYRVLLHGFVFVAAAWLLMVLSGFPDIPVRGNIALDGHYGILFVVILSTIMLTLWVVENARLCERLIDNLSAKPSLWNRNAINWAIRDNKVAQECVSDWLDIKLVSCLTATLQPLIWGPVVCIFLLVMARSPVIDDWDLPWGLEIVFITLLLYAISAELFLQRGAKRARAKAIVQLTGKISVQRNRNRPDESAIKRIEAEIERIMMLRDGAFRPWYELPLLRSFGGIGTLVVVLQYFAGVWGSGTL